MLINSYFRLKMLNLNYNSFLDQLFQKLTNLNVDVTGLELDHLGYIVSSVEEYNSVKQELIKLGDFIKEPIVGNWQVGHVKLFEPMGYKSYVIPVLELIAPLQGETPTLGFEHAEFVLKESYQSYMAKYPKLNWDISAINRPEFSMIKLRLDENTQVKFHLKPILAMD